MEKKMHACFSYSISKQAVLLEENEVIVGVVAKLYPGYQTVYTDF
jgi:hypothetical protein